MWSQVVTIATTPHFGSKKLPLIQSLSRFLKPPSSSLAEAFVWTEQRRSPIRSTPDGPAPMQHHFSYSRIFGVIELTSQVSAFLTFDPMPSIEFPWARSISRNNCRQVAFWLLNTKPGSRLHSTIASFWASRGRTGLYNLVSIYCISKGKNDVVWA